ncbi:Aste57867_15086 [Aphanomyces stellatus]|uniref:Aste57867_15086 protein n=1 Tax=Aphanomyces stellatus TaxID=120398 RepID=A0A485L2D6_9STRA|nr:hypothetical protein As57867_015030 [Aphanomyces stellatus]VFT91899.1 Aste57867_15086 [Aphanomyces stellatus]
MPLDLQTIKNAIEDSIEDLVRVADTKINWNHSSSLNHLSESARKGYVFLPGVYTWEADKSNLVASSPPMPLPTDAGDAFNNPPTHNQDEDPLNPPNGATVDEFPPFEGATPPAPDSPQPIVDPPPLASQDGSSEHVADPTYATYDAAVSSDPPETKRPSATSKQIANNSVAAFLMNDDDIASISYTLILHGDNTFEYVWKQKRTGQRPMEHKVELTGRWHKPVLNRDRYGERDQRVFLEAERARFLRLANYDAASNVWKQTLRTLTRNGDDWVVCGENDRGLPPLRMVFNVLDDNVIESIGALLPHEIITNAIPSRILSGLTKKAGTKLGSPIDVMTDKWLPCRKLCLQPVQNSDIHVKSFNPVLWYV